MPKVVLVALWTLVWFGLPLTEPKSKKKARGSQKKQPMTMTRRVMRFVGQFVLAVIISACFQKWYLLLLSVLPLIGGFVFSLYRLRNQPVEAAQPERRPMHRR